MIDPLFLDELKAEFSSIRDNDEYSVIQKNNRYKKLHHKICNLTFLDPAAGSGNFLTETYICLRQLEFEIISELKRGKNIGMFDSATEGDIQDRVKLSQFYGIEINDFAVSVAETALWISRLKANAEGVIVYDLDEHDFPLDERANIICENALRFNWADLIEPSELSYIMGNPPFIGSKKRDLEQREDVKKIIGDWPNSGNLDYVCCWYKVSADYIRNTNIKVAFVSTNSITQGEEVASLWLPLRDMGIVINFAYRTFKWYSESSEQAQVHCVIVGFSMLENDNKFIVDGINKEPASHINGYLMNYDDVFLERRSQPLCDVPEIIMGPMSISGNNLILTEEERNHIICNEPESEKWIRRFSMGREFTENKERYCLWLKGITEEELNALPLIKARVEACRTYRATSKPTGDAYKYKDTPHLFRPAAKFNEDLPYFAMPQTSTQNRVYIPMGFVNNGMIPGQKLYIIPNASIYIFAIMNSIVHMAWMRTVCGRMKSDYSYSVFIVYNNFPWPDTSLEQKKLIEQAAQGILDARALYPDKSLADLYDPEKMPAELQEAHNENDKAVMEAYGFSFNMSEPEIVAELMKMYQKLIEKD